MKKLNVVIPMAGMGKRFMKAGYTTPKPFLNVGGKMMIERVIENLTFPNRDVHYHLVALIRHRDYMEGIVSGSPEKNIEVSYSSGTFEGALIDVLNVRKEIENGDELLIANSDQILDWETKQFITFLDKHSCIDGVIVTFNANEGRWSYAKTDGHGVVTEVAEKVVISENATVGLYWFRHGADFVESADSLIHKDIRVGKEFYVCPVFNEMVSNLQKKVVIYPIPSQSMHGLGIPEDYEKYLEKEGFR